MDIIERRRGLIGQKESDARLPRAYQEVEYIEGTGTQYIDTGFAFQSNSNIRLKFKVNITSLGDRRLFGYYIRKNGSSWTNSIFVIQSRATNNFEVGSLTVNNLFVQKNVDYNIDLQLVESELIINGNSYGTMTATITEDSVYILGTKWTGNPTPAYAKLYYLTVYDNGELAMDFVPCYRKRDGEIGMYDLVSETFFTNAGTGEFLKGADV